MRLSLMILPLAAAILACGGSSDSTGPGTTGGGGGGGGGGTTPVATTSVEMKSIAFTPAAIKVVSGATVTWTNSDGFNHNVTFDNSAVAPSGNFATGNKSLVMPTAAGTYTYKCTLHPGMAGSVVVQ
jgi:plastocyanin